MENYEVKVNNWDESKEVQELYIALGATCGVEQITSRWVCLYYKLITFYDLLPNVNFKQVTIQQLRDLVVLKRNDINDANYESENGDRKYYLTDAEFFEFINGAWVNIDEYVDGVCFKSINKEGEVKMKEYIAKVSGDWRLVDSHELVSGRIEVPEGADILYLNEMYESSKHFFKTVSGKSYYKYLDKDSEWIEYSDEGLDEFKENIDNFRIMWQRNLTATTNTSIQDKLKFIEKWLNGEKIQYILGIESEKTQWHNFTEGAMQYIKRSDIKFREAPKYVTINGIEFKSVESLLKHVKNNFDLDGGIE